MSVPYSASGNADANGTVQLRLGPTRGGERWSVRTMTVTNTSSVLAPICRVYRNSVTPTAVVDVTGTGSFDTSTLSPPILLGTGESLIAEFSGCDVGSFSVFTLDTDTAR